MDRRQFLRILCGTTGCSVLGPAIVEAAGPAAADLIVTNGVIVTMNDRLPVAQAMAVTSGKVAAVGSAAELARHRGPSTRVIDLGGRAVSPGLIDAHSHLIGHGQMELMYVNLRPPRVDSFASLGQVLTGAARTKPKGEWIIGRGFQDFKEGRFPRRQELDEMVGEHPLLIIHWGGQFGVANTLALQEAGLLRKGVADPYGGKFLREAGSGLPDGVLAHYPAIYAVYKPLMTEEEQLKCARWSLRQFAKQGVTCIHDNFVNPKYAATYVRLERMGQLPARIRVYPYVWNLEHARRLVGGIMRYRGTLARLQGVKLAVDGYALMYKIPPEHKHLGVPMHPRATLDEIVSVIHGAGLQADVHAVGDMGVDWTLAAYEKAVGGVARSQLRRHRIEHFPFLKLDSIRKAAEMQTPVCVQPTYVRVRADDFRAKLGRISRSQIDTIVPLHTFVKEGVQVAFGSDVPAFPSSSPLDSIRCAMERLTPAGYQLDPSESISFMEALRIHTVGGAYASFDEGELGSLDRGKAADFVIWNKDLRTIKKPSDLDDLAVQATYLAGTQVHGA